MFKTYKEDPVNPIEGYVWYSATHRRMLTRLNGKNVPYVMPPRLNNVKEATHFGTVEVHSCDQSKPHYHQDKNGILHRCYHKCRTLFTWQFFVGLTLMFPLEHTLWTKVWPFYEIANFLGLGIAHH